MRHGDLPSTWPLLIQKDKNLRFIIEEKNHKDPHAIRIENESALHLGVYAEAIKSLIQHNSITDIRHESSPQWWLAYQLRQIYKMIKLILLKKHN